jgi:transposase
MDKSTVDITRETGLSNGMINNWIKAYRESGMEGLIPKRKPGNALSKYSSRKNLTKEEQLEYENMKLRIENEMLKKGFLMKEDGTYVKFMK